MTPVVARVFAALFSTVLFTSIAGCSQDVLYNDDLGPLMVVNGAILAFGDLGVGCESDPLGFTVGNTGDQELQLNVGAINSLAQAFEFAGENGPGDHAIAPGDEMEFQILFVPTTADEVSGSIRVEPTNVTEVGSARTIDLSGTGTGDEDGDGWAEECGDPDDTDPDVYPGEE